MNCKSFFLYGMILIAHSIFAQDDSTIYHIEFDGLLAVEAEHYFNQSLVDIRKWYELSENSGSTPTPDGDGNHYQNASNGKYMEILPDTRRTSADPLNSENFNGEPGYNAIISYKTYFNTPGKYYIWARCYSTGTEDNGVHVGIDGTWPESGKRIQWCDGKDTWTWSNKQRTDANHCGVPYQIFLNIPVSGFHTISFSMREDGFELDKWIMTNDRNFTPWGMGPTGHTTIGVDTTKPPAPVLTLDMINEHKVKLTWEKPDFGNTSLIEYSIFRNGELYAKLPVTDTTFIDSLLYHESQYSYSISTTSIWLIESDLSAEVNVSTGSDTKHPEIVFAEMSDSTGIVVKFDEPMDSLSLLNSQNYNTDDNIDIENTRIWSDLHTVELKTSSHVKGQIYNLGLDDILDLAGNNLIQDTISYRMPEPRIFDYFDIDIINSYKYMTYNGAISVFVATFQKSNSVSVCEFNIPFKSKWHLWARIICIGGTGDPNAWNVKLNDNIIGVLGNYDNSYNIWHWAGNGKIEEGNTTPVALGELKPGKYSLEFSAAEPEDSPGSNYIYLDVFYVSNSRVDYPTDQKVLNMITDLDNSETKILIPTSFKVTAYPNPFNPSTQIRLFGATGPTNIKIYNLIGEEVASFQNLKKDVIQWSPKNLSTGMYIIKAESDKKVSIFKILLLK